MYVSVVQSRRPPSSPRASATSTKNNHARITLSPACALPPLRKCKVRSYCPQFTSVHELSAHARPRTKNCSLELTHIKTLSVTRTHTPAARHRRASFEPVIRRHFPTAPTSTPAAPSSRSSLAISSLCASDNASMALRRPDHTRHTARARPQTHARKHSSARNAIVIGSTDCSAGTSLRHGGELLHPIGLRRC